MSQCEDIVLYAEERQGPIVLPIPRPALTIIVPPEDLVIQVVGEPDAFGS